MEGTPRLRSAFPSTPHPDRNRRPIRPPQFTPSPAKRDPLPQISTLNSAPAPQPNEPLIGTHILDAPTQRLYAAALWVALISWRLYDWSGLMETEEQSLGLFIKWIALDGLYLFGLPMLRIPWLEWSSSTMTLIFVAHAFVDAMLMFRIPIPLGAAVAAVGRGVWGAYEMAVNEHAVNLNTIMFNESLILGRQIVHILPEGSAVLNPQRESFCLDPSHAELKLPITINATNPVSMEMLRVDLDTQFNETLYLSKSNIKTMHREASRLLSYSDDPNEPKTLYYTIKKPGLYVLTKVIDESNLEVSRKNLAHTVVVPCPKAAILPSVSNRCKGELSELELEVTGTPPLKVKYRKMVNKVTQDSTFESIQPQDLESPLLKQSQHALAVPNRIETEWARSRIVRVPLSEGLAVAGKWVYAIDEVSDGFGNTVMYSNKDQKDQERNYAKASHLHQVINVHERPTVNLHSCSPQRPLKVAKDDFTQLPLEFGSTGHGALNGVSHHINLQFIPQAQVSSEDGQNLVGIQKQIDIKDLYKSPLISEPGLYSIHSVATEFCEGDVLEPATCLLENPPQPSLAISEEEIFDKCAGSPIGLRVDLDLVGTPPFEVHYRATNRASRWSHDAVESVNGGRAQIELTPQQVGHYIYEFYKVSDAVYKDMPLKGLKLEQSVKPLASARFATHEQMTTCVDERTSFDISMTGEPPFNVEYELLHAGRRTKYAKNNVTGPSLTLETEPLKDGGDYTMALISITDRLGCKEFLKDEARISVRHQKPKVSFGHLDGKRNVDALEGKKIELPLRLAGEAPWTVTYLDVHGAQRTLHATSPNEAITVDQEGSYRLLDVYDKICPGTVDDLAKEFQVSWIARPEMRIPPDQIQKKPDNLLIREDACEGDEDAVEMLFKGAPPYQVQYTQHVTPDHGAIAPKKKDLRAAVNIASLRMDTSQAGLYEYHFSKLEDANYDHSANHFSPLTIQQRVYAKPSAAFANPGKTYGFCAGEAEGEEVIPVHLTGRPPFDLEVEIKHNGTVRPELVQFNNIPSTTHNIRIPHSRLHLGRSGISLRRVSDALGCSRSLDSSVPRVQIAVHNAPSITPLEVQEDFCVGDRLNFALAGVAPFTIFYTFEGAARKASVTSGTHFRRLAERPGTLVITGLQDAVSPCRAAVHLERRIHGLPSVRVSKGRDSYIDIHAGSQAEISFEFSGAPPFEFTYTRSANTAKGGKKPGAVLDMRSEISDDFAMAVWASEEGTYEVVAIKDRYCAYAKPGVGEVGAGRGRIKG